MSLYIKHTIENRYLPSHLHEISLHFTKLIMVQGNQICYDTEYIVYPHANIRG